jgi:SAM-dependent methyltransferase
MLNNNKDAGRWDTRYRDEGAPTEPHAFLREHIYLLPTRGDALDIACGAGRNAIYVAQRGLCVTGVDISAEGLRIARERASIAGVDLTLIQADLEEGLPLTGLFDVILCFYYLQRSLWPHFHAALRPNGLLVMETFTVAQNAYKEDINPAYLLQPGELTTAFADWSILVSREEVLEETPGHHKAVASIIAQRL